MFKQSYYNYKIVFFIIILNLINIKILLNAKVLDFTFWKKRTLKEFSWDFLQDIYGDCPQGEQAKNSQETMLNDHTWWEENWGRTDDNWPRIGTKECWENIGNVCALPRDQNVVCVPGSRRGSTINKGWAFDPKGQDCRPGVHCLYACEPGYYWTYFNDEETSNYDSVHAHQKGHCDGTWNYGTSTHGVLCKEDGTLDIKPDKPLCALGETYVFAENRLDKHVFICQTVFPGHEIFSIPTLVKPGETVMITTQPKSFWSGPTYPSPTHGDFYVSFAGADIMEACTWDEFSPSGAALLPYEIGSGVEDNGAIYSAHYFYQQPNSEVPSHLIGYKMDIECESTEKGVCGEVLKKYDVVKVDIFRKPKEGTTKVKFVFNPPDQAVKYNDMYDEPIMTNLDLSYVSVFQTSTYEHHNHDKSSIYNTNTEDAYNPYQQNTHTADTYFTSNLNSNEIDIYDNDGDFNNSTYSKENVLMSPTESVQNMTTPNIVFNPFEYIYNNTTKINAPVLNYGNDYKPSSSHITTIQSQDENNYHIPSDYENSTHPQNHHNFILMKTQPQLKNHQDYSNRYGRRMKAIEVGNIMIENYLKESIIMCIYNENNIIEQKLLKSKDQVALKEGSILHIVKQKTMGGLIIRCKQTEYQLPWILSIGMRDMDNNLLYSFGINPKNKNIHHHTDYKISLSCESEEDEICTVNNGHELLVLSGKNPNIKYRLKPKNETKEEL